MSRNPESKDGARVRIIPPLVPLLTILLGVGLQRLWPISPDLAPDTQLHYWIGGAIVAGSVLILGLWPILLFKRREQNPVPWTPTPAIEVDGPYRFTRNPMYLQMVLVCVGFAVMLMNGWVLVLTPLAAWLLHRFAILPEEAYLEQKFGEAYLAYKRGVRRWI